jgi:hypothetical protein
MPDKKHPADVLTLEGSFLHLLFSPKGAIEGLMVDHGGAPAQLVCDAHDAAASAGLADLREGEAVVLEGTAVEPSSEASPAHPVYRLKRLVSVAGRPAGPAHAPARLSGTVVRFHFAKHGAANGVVLDSGDFIHTKPDGLQGLGLRIGDAVEAEGEARPLAAGGGRVVEARVVNGQPVGAARG